MNTDLKRNAGRLALTEKILQRRWGGQLPISASSKVLAFWWTQLLQCDGPSGQQTADGV